MLDKVLTGAMLLALVPIWRDPSWQGGISGIEALCRLATEPQKEHISVEEALRLAREAYLQTR